MFFFIFGTFPAIILPILHLEGIIFIDNIYKTFSWYILLFISYIMNISHAQSLGVRACSGITTAIISMCLVTQITLSFLYSFSSPFIFWEYIYDSSNMWWFISTFILEYVTRYYIIIKG